MADPQTLPDFMTERTRLLEALQRPENRDIPLRLIGALAFRTHCPEFGYIQDSLGRKFTDIDFVCYQRYNPRVIALFKTLGYAEDVQVTRLFGDQRLVFNDEVHDRHIDVFLDQLTFSHVLPLKGRLEVDYPTIPVAELFVEKMQIARINEKDLIDTIMLLREHQAGDNDKETINLKIITGLTGNDWGLWRTMTGNFALVREFLGHYPQLTPEDCQVVTSRLDRIERAMNEAPKSLKWKARARVGDRVKWYEDVEDLHGRT